MGHQIPNEVPLLIQKNWHELIKPIKLDVVPGADPQRLAPRPELALLERR